MKISATRINEQLVITADKEAVNVLTSTLMGTAWTRINAGASHEEVMHLLKLAEAIDDAW